MIFERPISVISKQTIPKVRFTNKLHFWNGYLNNLESILLGSGIGIRIPFPIVGVLRFDFGLGIIDNKIKSKSFHFGIGQKF